MLAHHQRISWILLAAILLLAALLRFWRLDALPPGLYHDEAYNGLDALSLLNGKTFPQFYEGWELYPQDAYLERPPVETQAPIFFEGNYGREPLHIYLMALSISLFGASPFAIRAVPAAAGVLSVFTTFLAARALLGETVGNKSSVFIALLAAFFLAILFPAVHFSRFGLRAMVFVPAETLAVTCFWGGINRHEKSKSNGNVVVLVLFVCTGFFLGLGIYTFAAARLFPLVWLLFIPIWFWVDQEARKAYWKYILAMATASVIIALPILNFFARYPYYFIFRIAYVANKGKGAVEDQPLQTWLMNIGRVGRGLIWQGETHLRHNLPGRPYMGPVQAIFFFMGLGRSLKRLAQGRYLFLLIWFGVMLLPSIMSGDAPHFGRLIGVATPVSIMSALGAEWIWRKGSNWLYGYMEPRNAGWLATSLLVFLLAGSATITIRDYFSRYANHPDLATDFYLEDWQMGQYADSYTTEETRIFLSPVQEELATIYFALGDADRLRNYDGSNFLLPAGTPGIDSLYLLRPGEKETLLALQNYFPRAPLDSSEQNFESISVQADAPRIQTQTEISHAFGDRIVLLGWSSELQQDQVMVTLTWLAKNEMDKDYTAYLHLIDENGEILGQVDQPPVGYPTSDWVPGEIIVAQFSIPWTADRSLDQVGIRSGFYDLASLEPLGDAAILAEPGSHLP